MQAFRYSGRPRFACAAIAISVVFLGHCFLPASSLAADTRDRLLEVQRSLEKEKAERERLKRTAEVYAADLDVLKRRLVAAARRAQGFEAKVSDLEHRIAALHAQERDKRASLRERHRHLTIMLAALQRLARHPPGTLIALPTKPADTVRSAILLRGAVPRLEAQAAALRDDLRDIADLRQRIAVERRNMVAAGSALDAERRELAGLIGRKSRLERQARVVSAETSARIADLARQARSLQELIDQLAITRKRLSLTKPAPPKATLQTPSRRQSQFEGKRSCQLREQAVERANTKSVDVSQQIFEQL